MGTQSCKKKETINEKRRVEIVAKGIKTEKTQREESRINDLSTICHDSSIQ